MDNSSCGTFAEHLREAMGEMTQEELERLSGVSQSAISLYLRGACENPSLRTLTALEQALPKLRAIRERA